MTTLLTHIVNPQALLLDQFGVLHDGRRPYPGAIEAVAAAAASGLKLLIISNSSRRWGGHLMSGGHDCRGMPPQVTWAGNQQQRVGWPHK